MGIGTGMGAEAAAFIFNQTYSMAHDFGGDFFDMAMDYSLSQSDQGAAYTTWRAGDAGKRLAERYGPFRIEDRPKDLGAQSLKPSVVDKSKKGGDNGGAGKAAQDSRLTTPALLTTSRSTSIPAGITKDLLREGASKPGNKGVTPIGRAFQKHTSESRAGTFTGVQSGNAAMNTSQGMSYLNKILDNPGTTYTARNLQTFGNFLDIRMPDGTGARYSADGTRFICFLEKYTNR